MRRQMFENERTFLEAVAGDLLKGGTGTVDLNNNNSTWGGDITVTNGVLRPLQNNALGDFLQRTGNRVLVEASPVDPIWGIGLAADSEFAAKPPKWRGKNLLGFALMEVRKRF